ncbi:hypothetical protein PIN31009_01863 [Pandoraea iniqua]|uniref:hypothetical protein n=1 Tax=Pandoraea iniqua TaxID=2508288 RepID=UPI0012429DF5|nr:hypothetical protein [Pandoraea iniqua]VVD95691.1 hypothetical protein PIN31009_01863 [Pandoraea iniqua]
MSEVTITVSGRVGSGKSALLGEIEILMKALGLPVRYQDAAAAKSEKNMTHADWTDSLEMYKPSVILVEQGPSPAKVGGDEHEALEWPALPRFPTPTIRHANGSGYFTEHQMRGYANAYGEAVRAALSADGGDGERLSQIAWLIASIFVHGGFKAETHNERELERLLRENGTFFDSIEEYDAAIAGKAKGA